MSERRCAECGNMGRMVSLPPEETECPRCTGRELDPVEAARREERQVFKYMKGVYDSEPGRR